MALGAGATRIANDLRDLDPDMDGLVAGQLWIEVSILTSWADAASRDSSGARVAEVCAELGVGDRERRRDRVWAESIRVGVAGELEVVADGYES